MNSEISSSEEKNLVPQDEELCNDLINDLNKINDIGLSFGYSNIEGINIHIEFDNKEEETLFNTTSFDIVQCYRVGESISAFNFNIYNFNNFNKMKNFLDNNGIKYKLIHGKQNNQHFKQLNSQSLFGQPLPIKQRQ